MVITSIEREIIALTVAGLPNKAVADRVNRSIDTVKFHLSKLRRETGASNTAELCYLAGKLNLIERD